MVFDLRAETSMAARSRGMCCGLSFGNRIVVLRYLLLVGRLLAAFLYVDFKYSLLSTMR